MLGILCVDYVPFSLNGLLISIVVNVDILSKILVATLLAFDS